MEHPSLLPDFLFWETKPSSHLEDSIEMVTEGEKIHVQLTYPAVHVRKTQRAPGEREGASWSPTALGIVFYLALGLMSSQLSRLCSK